eukprot:TRINITY_DN24088_c0_g2_i1.p1 TRINITY_DN24088_c0_g2~~TRINITY_DN24088_c0_g2_i1.p1  ORF type:complete len:243 (-),score=72.86 TRINITY_DN24088_c0_g2_i1:50-778(-)
MCIRDRGMVDEDDREPQWVRACAAALSALHAASTNEEGALEAYYLVQGAQAPQDSGDPKNPNPEHTEALESMAAMQPVLRALLDAGVTPECFAQEGKCQGFFRTAETCLVLEAAVEADGAVCDAKWRVVFSGALADAPTPTESPGLTRRNVARFFECLAQLEGAGPAAERFLCTILQEDHEMLVADQQKAIRLDFVFTALLFAFENKFAPHPAAKVAKLALEVLDQSTLGCLLYTSPSPRDS